MAGLGDLIKKQKGIADESQKPASVDGVLAAAAQPTQVPTTPPQSESVASPETPASPAPAARFKFGAPAKPVEPAGLNNTGVPASPTPVVDESSRPAGGTSLASLKFGGQSESKPASGMSDALAAIAGSESAGIVPVTGGDDVEYVPQFPDLVDCKVPDRELPADITLEAKGFVEQLDQIYGIAYDPELFGQFVRTIMQELQEHPDYIKLMAPEDSYVLVRGLREAMGMAAVKKESKKKTTTASAKKAPKSSEMDALLDSTFGGDQWN